MTLEELIIKIRTEGLERAKEGIKGVGEEAKKAEGEVGGLTDSFDQFSNIPGPIGEAASKLSQLGNTVKGTYAAMQSASTAFGGATATSTALGGATAATASAIGLATAPTVAQAGAVGKLAVANAAAAATQEDLSKSYQKYREVDNLVSRTLYNMRKQLGDTTTQAKAFARTVTRELEGALKAAGSPTTRNELNALSSAADNASGGFTRLGTAAANFIKTLPGGAAALTAIAGAIGVFQALNFAGPLDDLGDMGAKMGVSATQAMLLKQEMTASGTSLEAYTGGLQKVAVALSKSDEEGKAAAEALKTLGVSTTDAATPQGLLNTLTEQYGQKLRDGKVSVDDMAALQLVLGKNYREVMVAVEAKNKADERSNELTALGLGLSADGAAAAAAHEEATNNLATVTSIFSSQLVADVIPAFTAIKDAMYQSYKNGGLVKVAFEGIKFAANLIMVPLRLLHNLFVDIDLMITSVGKALGGFFAAVATKSFAPLKEARKDVDAMWADRGKRMLPIWGTGDDNKILENQSGLNVDPTNPKKEGSGPTATEKAKDYTRVVSQLANIYEDLRLKALAMVGVDTERIKLQEKIRGILAELPGMTEDQRQSVEQLYLAQYDSNKAREQTLSIEKMITAEMAKQYQSMQDLRQRAAESALQAATDLKYSLLGSRERDAAQKRDAAVRPIDARIKQDQETVDRIEGTMGPISMQDIAALEVARKNLIDLKALRKEALDSVNASIQAANEAGKSIDNGLIMGLNRAMDQLPTMAEGVASLVTKAASGLQDTLVNTFVSGKFQVKDFFKMLLTELLKLITQLFIVQPLLQMFKAAFGGATGGGGATVAPAAAAANGLAFDSGKVIPFAKGGIFDGPTLFGLAGGNLGVAGEAGPEAAVPLIRGPNGKLGVQNFGKKSSDAVIVNNNISVNIGSVDSPERKDEMLREMKTLIRQESNASIYEAMRRGGALNPV